MRSRLPNWILLLYVALDLANPFVPGAVRFTAEEGLVWVEAMPHGAARIDEEHQAPRGPRSRREMVLPDMPERPPDRGATPPPRLSNWLADVRTGDPPARDFPPPATDDH